MANSAFIEHSIYNDNSEYLTFRMNPHTGDLSMFVGDLEERERELSIHATLADWILKVYKPLKQIDNAHDELVSYNLIFSGSKELSGCLYYDYIGENTDLVYVTDWIKCDDADDPADHYDYYFERSDFLELLEQMINIYLYEYIDTICDCVDLD